MGGGGYLLGVATPLRRATWLDGDDCVSEACCGATASGTALMAPAGLRDEGLSAF